MSEPDTDWDLVLFVGGQSPHSRRAIRNLHTMVDVHMASRKPSITVHDVLEKPELARRENILALPTLQRLTPLPNTRIIGDLSDIDKVWSALSDL